MATAKKMIFRGLKRLPDRRIPLPHLRSPHPRFAVAPTELGFVLDRHEPAVLTQFIETVEQRDGVVLDVGAHIGIYSVFAALSGRDVVAIEPHPENVIRIRSNIRRNNVTDHVSVHEAAAWDIAGEIGLVENTDSAQHRINDQSGGTTNALTLDSLVNPSDIGIVKLDVEGVGDRVIAGAEILIEEGDAIWIVEHHSENERKQLQQAFGPSYEKFELTNEHWLFKPNK